MNHSTETKKYRKTTNIVKQIKYIFYFYSKYSDNWKFTFDKITNIIMRINSGCTTVRRYKKERKILEDVLYKSN